MSSKEKEVTLTFKLSKEERNLTKACASLAGKDNTEEYLKELVFERNKQILAQLKTGTHLPESHAM